MKKKLIYAMIFLLIAGKYGWRLIPVHFLSEMEPTEIVAIKAVNHGNGNEYEITDSDDIAMIVNGIQEITFKMEGIYSEVDAWYCLTFMNANGEEIASLGVQNARFVRKDIAQKYAVFYLGDGELRIVADYLGSLEKLHFPDYDRDPDFSGL